MAFLTKDQIVAFFPYLPNPVATRLWPRRPAAGRQDTFAAPVTQPTCRLRPVTEDDLLGITLDAAIERGVWTVWDRGQGEMPEPSDVIEGDDGLLWLVRVAIRKAHGAFYSCVCTRVRRPAVYAVQTVGYWGLIPETWGEL